MKMKGSGSIENLKNKINGQINIDKYNLSLTVKKWKYAPVT